MTGWLGLKTKQSTMIHCFISLELWCYKTDDMLGADFIDPMPIKSWNFGFDKVMTVTLW